MNIKLEKGNINMYRFKQYSLCYKEYTNTYTHKTTCIIIKHQALFITHDLISKHYLTLLKFTEDNKLYIIVNSKF